MPKASAPSRRFVPSLSRSSPEGSVRYPESNVMRGNQPNTNGEAYTPHEEHGRFLLKNCYFIGPYPLDRFLEILDDLDADERYHILGGWMFNAWKIERRDGKPTEDEGNAAEYEDFKKKCQQLTETGVTDYFVVQSIVGFILTYLWDNAHGSLDDVYYRSDEAMLTRGRLDLESGKLLFSEEDLRNTEERKNNIFANTRLWRQRYELFCISVVKPLLDLPPEPRKLLDQN